MWLTFEFFLQSSGINIEYHNCFQVLGSVSVLIKVWKKKKTSKIRQSMKVK